MPLAGTEYVEHPIVALEFFGEGPLGLLAFYQFAWARGGNFSLPGDSLVAPTVMGSRARSKLLVYMHQKLQALQVVINRGAHLNFSHKYGVGNPICDMLSRGRPREACA
jgi:hypothetical protein